MLTDAPPSPGHQQPVENIGRFVDGGRDGLRCEGSEPVRDVGISLEARFAAIAGVDEVHRFALARGREELPVAGGGEAQAPEAGHGQLRLCLDHHGQGPVDRLAFDMPAREARELEEVMGIGGLRHLAEAQIEPLREEDVQESDPVLAWRAGAQVGESVGETGGGVHLQQDIGDPHLGQATIEVEHQFIDVLRHCAGGPADPEFAILDSAAGYPAVVGGIGEVIQALDQTRLVFGQPLPGFERNGQPGRCVRCFDGHQGAFHIAIAPGVREPDVAGAEGVAHLEKRGDFPKPAITGGASVEMLMPPRIAAQEGPGHVAGPGSDSSQRGKDRFAGAGSLDLEGAQHARRIAPEPGPALNHVSQGIGGHRVAELHRRGDNAFELLPAAGSHDGLFKRRAVPFCLE